MKETKSNLGTRKKQEDLCQSDSALSEVDLPVSTLFSVFISPSRHLVPFTCSPSPSAGSDIMLSQLLGRNQQPFFSLVEAATLSTRLSSLSPFISLSFFLVAAFGTLAASGCWNILSLIQHHLARVSSCRRKKDLEVV